LEEKGYLELQKPLEGSLFVGARITPKGIDLVEDEYQFNVMFPIPETKSSMQIEVFKEFNLLVDNIESSDEIGNDTKELIVEGIKDIQKELKRIEPSYSNIKKFLDKLRDRNPDIFEKVIGIIKNPTITRILSESAKKELENI
jgi:type I site-specific restriction endonuclease